MIDGLKPVQRFYLYSSLKNSKKEFKKVSAVSGIISDYGYNQRALANLRPFMPKARTSIIINMPALGLRMGVALMFFSAS